LLLQLDILQARKDNAKAIEVMKKLAALKAPATTGPDAGKLLADLKLSSAHIFLQKGDYPKAISEIESAKSSYTEPAQQAEALFCIAQARHGIARQLKTKESMQDAALAYLRVVARFSEVPSAPHVPESLLAAASIMEDLNDPAGARRLYQEVVSRYNSDPAAQTARQSLARLPARATQ